MAFVSAAGAIMLACDCCSGKRYPQVTAIDEDLSPEETVHRLRQFHGHLGPYAVLGYRLGQWILQQLGCPKYFGAAVTVHGPGSTPFTCMLDGLQMATGYTLGKGNLKLAPTGAASAEALFDVEVVTDDGHLLQVQVPRQVESIFAEWMAQQLSEQAIYDRVMAAPASQLWRERS